MLAFIRTRLQQRDERGMSLLAVMVISVFVFTVSLSVASTTALNTVITANTRSDIKAFAAAEAGRDTILARLSTVPCQVTGSVAESATTPAYTWRMYRYRSSDGTYPRKITDSGVTLGCPTFASTHILIHVTGLDGDAEKTITSVYRWHPNGSSPLRAAVGSGQDLPLSNTEILLPPDTTTPGDVIVNSGTFRCLGSRTRIQGSVYNLQGGVELGGCSTVNGRVSSAGVVTFGGGDGRVVDGNVCTKSTVDKYRVGNVGGQVLINQATCPGLEFEGWVDYNPIPEITEVVPSTACKSITGRIGAATQPAVIDARACGTVSVNSAVLRTDVTVIAKGFDVLNAQFTSADGLGYMMNFVTPDRTVNSPRALPDCADDQMTSKFQSMDMRPPMMGLIYSPCTVSHVTGTWSGQIYSGLLQSNFAAGTIYYVPTPAPGLEANRVVGYANPVLLHQAE